MENHGKIMECVFEFLWEPWDMHTIAISKWPAMLLLVIYYSKLKHLWGRILMLQLSGKFYGAPNTLLFIDLYFIVYHCTRTLTFIFTVVYSIYYKYALITTGRKRTTTRNRLHLSRRGMTSLAGWWRWIGAMMRKKSRQPPRPGTSGMKTSLLRERRVKSQMLMHQNQP